MEKIFEARTKQAGIEKAIRDFGVSEEFIEIEILKKSRGGFLGLNGKVTLKATVVGFPKTEEFIHKNDHNSEKHRMSRSSSSQKTKDNEFSQYSNGNEHKKERERVAISDEKKSEIASIIETLASKMGIDLDVEFYTHEGQLFASLLIEEESQQNLLIGKFGKNIDAFQSLVNVIAQQTSKELLETVVLDIEDYRIKRTIWLQNMAVKNAKKVLQTQKSYVLDELNPYDRRLVHGAIKNIKGVSTHSEGNTYCKRIKISPV